MAGIVSGAIIVFFTYIGFDAVSTAAEECRRPQRDMPFGIIATLMICTILYGSVAIVLTGIANWKTLDHDAPVAVALKNIGYNRIRLIVTRRRAYRDGVIVAGLSVRAGPNLVRDVARPAASAVFSERCIKKNRTPYIGTWIAGLLVGIPAGLWDIDTFAELTNIGTLFAFIVVAASVIVLRRKQPDRPRSFRVPLVPLVPILSIICCMRPDDGLPAR